MTTFSVVFTEQAARELEDAADWWAAHRSKRQAARWYEGISAKIGALQQSPASHPLATEGPAFSYELRELHSTRIKAIDRSGVLSADSRGRRRRAQED